MARVIIGALSVIRGVLRFLSKGGAKIKIALFFLDFGALFPKNYFWIKFYGRR